MHSSMSARHSLVATLPHAPGRRRSGDLLASPRFTRTHRPPPRTHPPAGGYHPALRPRAPYVLPAAAHSRVYVVRRPRSPRPTRHISYVTATPPAPLSSFPTHPSELWRCSAGSRGRRALLHHARACLRGSRTSRSPARRISSPAGSPCASLRRYPRGCTRHTPSACAGSSHISSGPLLPRPR